MANKGPYYQVGAYFGKVMKQALTTAGTGTVQFVLRFKVVAYPDDESGDRVELPATQQYERTIYMPLTDKTMEYQVENLQRIGFEGDDLALLDPSVEGFHDFSGDEITVWCGHDDYNGTQKEKWQISSGPREIIAKEVDPKAMRNLNSLFGKAKRASGSKELGGRTNTSKSAAPGRSYTPPTGSQAVNDYADQGITDEDIPF